MRWASIENPSANNFFIKFVMKYKKTKVSHDFSFIFKSKYMLKMVCSFFFLFFFLKSNFFFLSLRIYQSKTKPEKIQGNDEKCKWCLKNFLFFITKYVREYGRKIHFFFFFFFSFLKSFHFSFWYNLLNQIIRSIIVWKLAIKINNNSKTK